MNPQGSTPLQPEDIETVNDNRLDPADFPVSTHGFRGVRYIVDKGKRIILRAVCLVSPAGKLVRPGSGIDVYGLDNALAVQNFALASETSGPVAMLPLVLLELYAGGVVHTAFASIFNIRNLNQCLNIIATANAGVFTLLVEGGLDSGGPWFTVDTAIAAASFTKTYDNTHLGSTGLNLMAFEWIRVTLGDAGVGNTTILAVVAK